MIRWLKVELEDNGDKYITSVTKPYSLGPNGEGQKQLLTIMSMTSAILGLDYPEYTVQDTNEVVQIMYLIGEGATSIVYAAKCQNQTGVIKCLKRGHEALAKHELKVLTHSNKNNVSGIPYPVIEICEGVLFFSDELTHLQELSKAQASDLIDCLQGAHKAGVVHRDVRPDNIMEDMYGNVRLIDWGFASFVLENINVPLRGTFRYASEEVLNHAILKSYRVPRVKDDVHSVLRVILSSLQPRISYDLAKIGDRDLQAARNYWAQKRKLNDKYDWAFNSAESCEYDELKKIFF
jgi:serine/threonine protein kinase